MTITRTKRRLADANSFITIILTKATFSDLILLESKSYAKKKKEEDNFVIV